MKYYNLSPKVLCCTAKNRILKKNIDGGFPESWWDEGGAEKLVKEGFLVPVEVVEQLPSVTVIKKTKAVAEEVKEEVSEKTPEEVKEDEIKDHVEPKDVPYVNWTEAALREVLSLRGIEFTPKMNKPELYKLYKGTE